MKENEKHKKKENINSKKLNKRKERIEERKKK